jgi:hypothetical protein
MSAVRWLLLVLLVLRLVAGEATPAPVRYGIDRDGVRVVVDLTLPMLPADQVKRLELLVLQELPEDLPVKPFTSIDDWVTRQHAGLVSGRDELKRIDPTAASLDGWFDVAVISTTWAGGGLISLRFEHRTYAGGAHPSLDLKALVFDAMTLQPLALDDLISQEKQAAFADCVTAVYRADQRLAPGTDLHQMGLQVDVLPAILPLVEAAGLTVVYEPYEVGPWSLGTITVHLTRDQARPFLRRDPWP